MKKVLTIVSVLIIMVLIFSSCNTSPPTETNSPTEISVENRAKPPTKTPVQTKTQTPTPTQIKTSTPVPSGEPECIQVVFSDGIEIFVCKP